MTDKLEPGEPVYSETSERYYYRLPEIFRISDQAVNWHLKKFISSVVDFLGDIDTLVDRIDFRNPDEGGLGYPADTSDLVDPNAADDSWLDWVGQLYGVKFPFGTSAADKRDLINNAATGWRSGTKGAVADAAKTELTGTKYAVVYDHSKPDSTGSSLIAGTEWDVTIVTRITETPDVDAVLAAVIRKGAKPAGVALYHVAYASEWNKIEALGSWDAIEALGSWNAIEETGLS